MVTMEKWCTNQQVTNVGVIFCCSNLLVGTPEAVCPPTNFGNKKHNSNAEKRKNCQWLAGLIDGDGCFLVSKQGYTSLEITVHAKDEGVLRKVKQSCGGSIKPRAGGASVRYRLHNTKGMQSLCTDVNGQIRHPVRYMQFKKVCSVLKLNAVPRSASPLHSKHGWFRGMFDADGTVTLKHNKESPQITFSVTQKDKSVPMAFYNVFGGSLYFDKSQNGYWTWRVQSKANV